MGKERREAQSLEPQPSDTLTTDNVAPLIFSPVLFHQRLTDSIVEMPITTDSSEISLVEEKDIKTNLLLLYLTQNTRDVGEKKEKKRNFCVLLSLTQCLYFSIKWKRTRGCVLQGRVKEHIICYNIAFTGVHTCTHTLWNSTPISIGRPHAVLSYAVSKQWSTFGRYRSSLETSQAEWAVLFHRTMALLNVLNSCAMLPVPHRPTPALYARKCSFVQLLISLTNWEIQCI